MLSPIWTPDALRSEALPYRGDVWRFVEAQHLIATLPLVDTILEQDVLEKALEESKPRVPDACRHLDYLLSTPFRYGAVYPNGSRFRRAGKTPGVFYSAEKQETGLYEAAFYRLLFFAEAQGLGWPDTPAHYTAFSARVEADRALDLTRAPVNRDKSIWTDLSNFAPCQDLADLAREADINVLRYQSVRDPQHRANIALLTCEAFSKPHVLKRATWHIWLNAHGVRAVCEHPAMRLQLETSAFKADPRLATLDWR